MTRVRLALRLARWPFALSITLIACGATGPNGPPPIVEPGAETLDGGASVCARACTRRKALGCLEPAFEGDCVPVCERAKAAKLYDPACAAAAMTIAAMRNCNVRCGAL